MIWHILKKDLRRLAMPALLATAMLAALALLDSWRYDFESGLPETVLNLILPLVWSVLIALAVQLDPLTSDTAFWLTRPFYRPALLAAKLLFAVVTIHLPVLIAHAFILSSHGFAFLVPELWWKQLLIFLAVTVPSLAIASVTSTLSGFVWCALAAGFTALLLDADLMGRRVPWISSHWMPGALALLLLAVGSAGIVLLQYARRTRWVARCAGMVIAAAAVLLFTFIPRELTSAMQCSLSSDLPRPVNVQFEPAGPIKTMGLMSRGDWVAVALPVKVTGVEGSDHIAIEQLSLRLTTANGRLWETRKRVGPDLRAYLQVSEEFRLSQQSLLPDRSIMEAVGRAPSRIDAKVSIRPYRLKEGQMLPPVFPSSDVPGLGRCSAFMAVPLFGEEMLKVICESPETAAPLSPVTLIDPQTGREWKQRLGDSFGHGLFPTLTWLSPLNRRQAFLRIAEKQTNAPGSEWLVPREVLSRAQIRIQPVVEEGCANVEYSFEIPDLRNWEVKDGMGFRIGTR